MGGVIQAHKRTSSPNFPDSWLFFSKASQWDRRGTEGWVRRPLSSLLLCQHHPGREEGRVCSGGGVQPGPARPQHTGCGEPRLPSRLTAQLVQSNSCQPVVSQPGSVCAHRGLPLAPAPKTAPRAAPLYVQLPTENSPTLVSVAPLAGCLATSNRFSKEAGSRALSSPTQKERAGQERFFALENRGPGFSFSQAASTPG